MIKDEYRGKSSRWNEWKDIRLISLLRAYFGTHFSSITLIAKLYLSTLIDQPYSRHLINYADRKTTGAQCASRYQRRRRHIIELYAR